MIESAKTARKVLAVDDNPTNLALLQVHLKKMGLTVIQALSGREGIELAIAEQPDLILLDIMMPEVDGYQTCQQIKQDERTAAIPVIFISARDQTNDKIAGLEIGAIDYITKPFDPGELRARVSIVLEMVSLQERLIAQANTDELTQLNNRRKFLEILEREVLRCQMQGGALCVAMLDLDHFKTINDTYGHMGGDVVLRQLAELLAENVRPLDIVARYGGEEFVLIMPETKIEEAYAAAERLRKLVHECKWKITAEKLTVTVSMGLAGMASYASITYSELVSRADAALYAAKHRGRDCVVSWDEIEADLDSEKQNREPRSVRELEAQITGLNRKLRQQVLGSVTALRRVLETKDPQLAVHSQNVKTYALAIAENMDVPEDFIEHLGMAASLHELDSLAGSDEETLAAEEPAAVAAKVLEPLGMFQKELPIIKYRFEHFDGTGKPEGLSGNEIPFGARILAVADAFESFTSARGLSAEQALDEIRNGSGALYDPEVVNALASACGANQETWPLQTVAV